MESTLGPDVGRSMRLGTELVIRHREVVAYLSANLAMSDQSCLYLKY